jgi:hypothetical protein
LIVLFTLNSSVVLAQSTSSIVKSKPKAKNALKIEVERGSDDIEGQKCTRLSGDQESSVTEMAVFWRELGDE